MSGLDLANRLRAAARARGVSMHSFLAPLSRNPKSFLGGLEIAANPRPHTVKRINALIAGEPLPKLERQILITVPHSIWCALDAEAKKSPSKKIADICADIVTDYIGRM